MYIPTSPSSSVEIGELNSSLEFSSDQENAVVDSSPCYTEIRTSDGALLWRSDHAENPQTDALFGLIGDVASYLDNKWS